MLIPMDGNTTIEELREAKGFYRKDDGKAASDQESEETEEDPEDDSEWRRDDGKQRNGKEIDHEKIIALHKAGWTPKKIAEEFGVTNQTIYNHLNREKENE